MHRTEYSTGVDKAVNFVKDADAGWQLYYKILVGKEFNCWTVGLLLCSLLQCGEPQLILACE